MICRIWHGWTIPANADAYEALLARFDGRSAHYEARDRRREDSRS